jgi:hypothetical protein
MPNERYSYDKLTVIIAQTLKNAQEAGFELPYFMTMVASNGSLMHARYDRDPMGGELLSTTLTSYETPPGFVAPINIMLTDSQGLAARAFLGS